MRARARGFTLMEVVITLVILMIVIGALFAVVQGQQTAFYQGNLQRASQGAARTALSFVEQRLVTAGYGMDPSLAFDFTSPVIPCPLPACPRDSTTDNDELVFYSRNPKYWWDPNDSNKDPVGNAWLIQSVAAGSVTVRAKPGDVFARGRILQAVCPGGETAGAWTYFVVSNTATIDPNSTGTVATAIQLFPAQASIPFLRQDIAVGNGCFSSGTARMYFIDRFRFHVRPVTTAAGTVPYLILDTGLDVAGNGWDESKEIVVAEGIETFQVGYDLTNAPLGTRGSTPGIPINFNPGTPDTAGASANGITTTQFAGVFDDQSWYTYSVGPPAEPHRMTDHQANIRAVRLSIRARGPTPNPTGGQPGVLVPVMNQDTLPSWIDPNVNYDRARIDATIPVRNMISRGMLDH